MTSWVRLFRELGDTKRQPRDLAARIVLVNDILLAGPHQLRLCALHRLDRGVTIALRDRFLDDPDRAAHHGPSRLVDGGAAGNLACRLLGGGRIGHGLDVSFGSVPPREAGWWRRSFDCAGEP